MASTQSSGGRVSSAAVRPGSRSGNESPRVLRRHEEAVVQAEARRLALALAPYRILHKHALERAAGATQWHEGGFDRALAAAVRAGIIERLPAGFYRDARTPRPGGGADPARRPGSSD